MTQPVTAEDQRAATAKEYGQYVAVEFIYIDGALAFAPGNPVPTSHVDRGVVNPAQVAKTNTKAAAAVTDTTPKG